MSHEIPAKRKYELKKRAEEMAETHQRITEAAIELHGNRRAVAHDPERGRQASGRRAPDPLPPLPTEADLFEACSDHYFTANPWPGLGGWRAIRDPQERLAVALDELYAYYERTEPMLANVLRDAERNDLARDASPR